MYPQNMSVEVFTNAVRTIFVMFCMRKTGWTRDMAENEWGVMMKGRVDVTSNASARQRRDAYCETSRRGSTFKMNRRDRINLCLTLENAINHATFSDEIYGEKKVF